MKMRNIVAAGGTVNSGKGIFVIFAIIVACFAFIIMKDIDISSGVVLVIGVFSFAVLLFASVNRPDMILYALVAYLPFSKILVGDFGGLATALNFTNILAIFALLVWVTTSLTKNQRFYTRTSLDIPLLIFMLLGCISLLKGVFYFGFGYLEELIFPLKRWLTPMFFYFIFFNMVKTKEEIKNITVIIMFTTFIVALMAIRDYIDIGAGSSLENARIGGIADQPNILAAFFVYYMFLFAGFMLVYWRNYRYWFLFLPFLACFRGIQVTFSRGGYVAFAAAALATAFFKNKVLFAVGVVFLIFALSVPGLLPKGMQYRMSSTFRDNKVFAQGLEDVIDTSSLRRVEAWKGGLKMIKEKPLFGMGYGLFPYLIPMYASVDNMDAHNAYILIAAEMGVPALLMFLIMLVIIFRRTLRLYKITKDNFIKALTLGFLGCLGGLVVANVFGGRLDSQEICSYFWIIAALIFRASYLEKQEKGKISRYVSKSSARLQKSIQ